MNQHYHFIGIGGIGMGALASLLLAKGAKVSGSDLVENDLTAQLKEAGALVSIGHDPQNIIGADCVVYSSAITEDNPELNAAQIQNIKTILRAELLAELMQDHVGITIAGAHGKTTTTSIISHLLVTAQLQPTTAIGGIVLGTSSNARLGAGKYFVAEVDESDRSFLKFSPKYSIITNIDFEHVDQYKDWNEIEKIYAQFIRCTQKDGLIFGCGEDERLTSLLKKERRPFKTYGFSAGCDIYASGVKFYEFASSFDCYFQGNDLGHIILELPGKHNILNALAAIGLGLTIGIEFKTTQKAFKSFPGVKRRFQRKEEHNSIVVIDDYAHHPTEINATLSTAQQFKKTRLVTIFQPHRYSRLQVLLDDFAQSLINTDYLVVTDVYAASEKPIEGISAQKLVENIKLRTDKPVFYLKQGEIVEHILKTAQPGDLILTLGAGDITKTSEALAEAIRNVSVEQFGEV